jgi:hypothetical protein
LLETAMIHSIAAPRASVAGARRDRGTLPADAQQSGRSPV